MKLATTLVKEYNLSHNMKMMDAIIASTAFLPTRATFQYPLIVQMQTYIMIQSISFYLIGSLS